MLAMGTGGISCGSNTLVAHSPRHRSRGEGQRQGKHKNAAKKEHRIKLPHRTGISYSAGLQNDKGPNRRAVGPWNDSAKKSGGGLRQSLRLGDIFFDLGGGGRQFVVLGLGQIGVQTTAVIDRA